MYQIIYASSAKEEMTPEKLDEIACAARQNNVRDNITGMLLYGDRSFFQVLEGENDIVRAMKERIIADPRHTGISFLWDAPIEERSFPDWSMGCYRVGPLPSGTSTWPIVNLDSILGHLPPTVAPHIMVLARTFFSNIAPHSR